MGESLPKRLKWLEHALQGLAFWIGHRHSLFNSYPLTEGSLIAEGCNLIQANLPNEFILLPECLYRNLIPQGADLTASVGQSRADLVICSIGGKDIGREGNVSKHVRFVIEVKRASTPPQEVDVDFRRLHNFLTVHKKARAFLIVVSESKAPSRFVVSGKSKLGSQPIHGTSGHYHVRRTVKATASFSGQETAHYVCLIEVFVQGQIAVDDI